MAETDKKPAEKTTGGTETETDTPKADNEHQRKINVGNLPSDVTEQQLRDHFSGHEIERVDIFHYRKYTLAMLLFKDKEAASKAITEKDGSIFCNRRLRIHLEYLTIRHIKRDVIVTVVEDENLTEEQLWDKVKGVIEAEPAQVLIFYPLAYISLAKDSDKAAILEKLNAAGFNAHDVNQRDQNQHLDIWRAAKLFHRNRNRVQLLNIPNKWIEDKEEMKKQCAEGGVITEAVTNNANQNQNASNYARIFYETEEQAAKAAAAINNRVVDGKRIYALHLGSALIPNYKTSVYVTPLDKAVTEEQVYDHFKQFGDIEFVNRRNCNDAAIICFKNADSVEKAIACVTFPAPTEENKDATKEVVVKKYDGPLVLRPQAVKRKHKTEDGKPVDPEERSKEQQEVLKKLQAYHPVFVGNVPLNCPPIELKRYFSQHGPIKFMFSPQILPYRTSAPHPVKTFIIYYNLRASAINACKFLDHKFFGGHRLHVLPLRGEMSFDMKKTIKMNKIPHLSEDALFKKIKPYVGKINRIVKKTRLTGFIELNDEADVEKLLKTENADHPLSKNKMELIKTPVSVRLYDEDDFRVLGGIAKILAKNPDMLKKTPLSPGGGPMNKRPRLNGPGFNQGPGGFNSNVNNPQAISDLLRLAFMSGKNVGESLASNQSSFNAPDPPIANSGNFGDGGFGNRNNRNNQGGNFRGQGRNMNQNNRGNNANNFGGNSSDGGNFQNAPGNQNRGGQNVNRGNQQNNQNRGNNDGGNMNQNRNNLNQNQGQVARVPQNKQQGVGNNNMNQNNRNNQGGGNMNRNQNLNRPQNNRNNNNFDNDSFGGGNNFGNNRNNNFANDNFSNDNFGNNRSNDNFSNDNFGSNNRNFGGNNRNQNDNFSKSFGSNNSGGGGNNRFNNDGGQFSNNNFNRNQNNRFDDDNNFGSNQKGGNFNQNRQNKNFNSGNQGGGSGGMSFGEFNSNTNRNFGGGGGGNSNFGSNNAGGNKWNSGNSQQSNTGSRLAGSIFSRRF